MFGLSGTIKEEGREFIYNSAHQKSTVARKHMAQNKEVIFQTCWWEDYIIAMGFCLDCKTKPAHTLLDRNPDPESWELRPQHLHIQTEELLFIT